MNVNSTNNAGEMVIASTTGVLLNGNGQAIRVAGNTVSAPAFTIPSQPGGSANQIQFFTNGACNTVMDKFGMWMTEGKSVSIGNQTNALSFSHSGASSIVFDTLNIVNSSTTIMTLSTSVINFFTLTVTNSSITTTSSLACTSASTITNCSTAITANATATNGGTLTVTTATVISSLATLFSNIYTNVTKIPAGSTCNSSLGKKASICSSGNGNTCSTTTNKCVVSNGTTCTADSQCQGGHCNTNVCSSKGISGLGGSCVYNTDCNPGVCISGVCGLTPVTCPIDWQPTPFCGNPDYGINLWYVANYPITPPPNTYCTINVNAIVESTDYGLFLTPNLNNPVGADYGSACV